MANCTPECRAMLERIEAKLDALISGKVHIQSSTDIEHKVKQLDLLTQIKLARTHEEQMAIIKEWNSQYRRGRKKSGA